MILFGELVAQLGAQYVLKISSLAAALPPWAGAR